VRTDHYDSFAKAYSQENESSLLNAHYERPAMINLAGDVNGHRVLDAGCGSGPLSAGLRAKGATVVGFDSSPAMIQLARERLGPTADLRVADLGQPLPFDDNAFDDVVASLVLHYLKDWKAPLAELRRVLKPGGRLILSVNHPHAYMVNYPEADYFALTQYSRGIQLRWSEVDVDVLAPATSCHHDRVHRGRVSHRGPQRTSLRSRHAPRAAAG